MEDKFVDKQMQEYNNPVRKINQYSLSIQWLIWAIIFMGCFFIAQLISSVLIVSYYKTVDLKEISTHPNNLNILRAAQMLASVFGFLVPALIFSALKDKKITRYAYADKKFPLLYLFIIPLMLYTVYPLIDSTYFINKWMPWNNWYAAFQDDYKVIVKGLLSGDSLFVLTLNLITIAILPAICEEWIFRGTLQRLFSEKMNIHLAVFMSSLFFSFIHFEFSGFLPRIVLGMFLGYLYYYSGSLWVNIYAHVVNNGAQVVFMYLNIKGIYKTDLDNPEMPSILELISYTAVFAIIWYLFLQYAQQRKISTFTP